MRRPLLLALFSLLAKGASAESIRDVSTKGARIHLGDLLDVGSEWKDLDLGPSPPPFGSRLVRKDDIERAAAASGRKLSRPLPAAFRVSREMTIYKRSELEAHARETIGHHLPRGAALVGVRGEEARVPAGWDQLEVDIPRPPRRTGPWTIALELVFSKEQGELARIPVTAEFSLGAAAMSPDVSKGSTVVVVVQRGLVHVQAEVVVANDANIGEIVPATLRSTGRTLRVRIVDGSTAELMEKP